jgi:hypothetical protein
MPKNFRITLTINVFVAAENEESAQEIAQEMNYSFLHPETNEVLEDSLIDWEVNEVDPDDSEEIEQLKDEKRGTYPDKWDIAN